MRHIIIDAAPAGWEPVPVDRDAIVRARDLSALFPGAGLQPLRLRRAATLDSLADRSGATRIWLAEEGSQVTGSFKVRGALCALKAAREAGVAQVVAASAGNHGAGVAHAARVLGLHATIVVPASVAQTKLRRMVGDCVTVREVQGGYDLAEQHALDLADRNGWRFVSPYDDDDVLAGNGASIAFEICEAFGGIPDWVLAPIGGGGLAVGLSLGLGAAAGEDPWSRTRVWTAQSVMSPAFALSVVGGRAVETLNPTGATLAEGLEGGIRRRAAVRAAALVRGVSVVEEAAIAFAMRTLLTEFGLRAEGSAATAAVPALCGLPNGVAGDVVVLLTGSNVDERVLGQVVAMAGRC